MKYCVLEDEKLCNECGECNRCDLNPDKICDNCCQCIDSDTTDKEYTKIPVADIVLNDEDTYLKTYYGDEEEEGPMESETIDPELLAFWEKRLQETEPEKQPIIMPKGKPIVRSARKRDQKQ